MAGVSLLQPQDVLRQHISYRQPMRSRRNSTSNPLPNPNPKNNRRKPCPQKNGSANFSTTDRLVPELDMVPKHTTIVEFYAGSGFSSSPPPSSLPVPAFFKKKSEDNLNATSYLRCLLMLDLAD